MEDSSCSIASLQSSEESGRDKEETGYTHLRHSFRAARKCESDAIFFLLEHKYSKPSLGFYGLKGQDYLLAQLLQSFSFLDVHLAVIVQKITKNEDDEDEEYIERDFEIGNWVNSNNTLIELEGLRLNYQSQLVGDESKLMNPVGNPVQRKQQYTGNAGTEVERWYHQAVLVAWPKQQTTRIYLEYSFDTVFGNLERQAMPKSIPFSHSISKEDSIGDLREILDFCRTQPWNTWQVPGSKRVLRLLKLCTHLDAKKEGLAVLDLLSCNGGIEDYEMAEAIAEFECRVAGKLILLFAF